MVGRVGPEATSWGQVTAPLTGTLWGWVAVLMAKSGVARFSIPWRQGAGSALYAPGSPLDSGFRSRV
jgi:hypothetical protein